MTNEGRTSLSIANIAVIVGEQIDGLWREILIAAEFREIWGNSFDLNRYRPRGCRASLTTKELSRAEGSDPLVTADLVYFDSKSGLPISVFSATSDLSLTGRRRVKEREITDYGYSTIESYAHPDFERPIKASMATLKTYEADYRCRRVEKSALVEIVFGIGEEWTDRRVPRKFDPVLQESCYEPVEDGASRSVAMPHTWVESTRLIIRRDGNYNLYVKDETGGMRSMAIGYELGGEIVGPASVVQS